MKKENSVFLNKLTTSLLNEFLSFFTFSSLTALDKKTENITNKNPDGRQQKKIALYFVLYGVLVYMSTATPDKNAPIENPIGANSL